MKIKILSAAFLVSCLAFSSAGEPYRDGDVVVFFGDSITHGGRYHEFVTDFYRTRFPDAKIRFVNSGIGGDNAHDALKRIPEDVAEYAPTHVAFHFGMNDVDRGAYLAESTSDTLRRREWAQTCYRYNFKALAEAVRNVAPNAAFTYLTPTLYDDTAVITNGPTTGWKSVNQVGCNTGLSLMSGFVLASADADKAQGVDWFSPLNAFTLRNRKGNPCFSVVVSDRVHPDALGHAVMAWTFLKAQGVPATVSDVEIDAASARAVRADNAAVSDVAATDGGIAFKLLAKALPFPVPSEALPYADEFGLAETLNRETVKVTGLAEGAYVLAIDGIEVGRYTAAEFAKGISLGFNPKTPQYAQAQAVAQRVAELTGFESILRNHHSARWFFFGKASVDDIPAFRKWYEERKGKPNGFDAYFGAFIPGYLDYWPHYREVRAKLWSDQDAVRALAKPVPRTYLIQRR